jgi:FkbM family methyltransferase
MKRLPPYWHLSLLLRIRRKRKRTGFQTIYEHLLRQYENSKKPIPAKIHGFNVLLNPGNTYPFIIQDTPLFNAPLVELVFQAFSVKGRPLRFVDVGAATGDTVLLLRQKCPSQVGEFICVEGDAEFFNLLSKNMRQFENVHLEKAVLSRKVMQIRSLVKHHQGTATAIGDEFVSAIPLDEATQVRKAAVDVLKIDVDGFDGAVLSGARGILASDQPIVIFEWHPKLILAANNDPLEAFLVLRECGYKRYLWFNNVGTFSHFSAVETSETLKRAADYLVSVNNRADEHFDVIALPDSSLINEVVLAASEYSRYR